MVAVVRDACWQKFSYRRIKFHQFKSIKNPQHIMSWIFFEKIKYYGVVRILIGSVFNVFVCTVDIPNFFHLLVSEVINNG